MLKNYLTIAFRQMMRNKVYSVINILGLAIGIRDGSEIAENNLVAFGVKMNGLRVWGQQTNERRWIEADIPLDLMAGDMVRFEFTTEALARHEWTWAVWGGPELTGRIGQRSKESAGL